MALNLNRVLIAGNLTRDPEMRDIGGGKYVAAFALAINEKFKAADGTLKESVVFVDVEAWGRTAENVGQYLAKGKGAFVEGRLKLDQWETKEGQKRQRLKVVADTVTFTSPPGERDRDPSRAANAGSSAASDAVKTATANLSRPAPGDDDPPF